MREAGYLYVNLDDCWAGKRDRNGNITPEQSRFPSGMKALAEYIHSKGLLLGLYTDSGTETCVGHRPGSYGHYQQDANTYASWGVDYVKMDWCNTGINGTQLDPKVVYHNMSIALNNTRRPILFNICEWGVDLPWVWAAKDGNSWRSGPDHHDTWRTGNGVSSLIEHNVGLAKYAGPGGWNDMDFLMTGGQGCKDDKNICPGMTQTEYVTEFSMWSLLASPLIVATDPRPPHFTPFKQSVLLNKEVIAVNQDKAGIQGDRVALINCPNGAEGKLTCQAWAKPLADGTKAVILLNKDSHPRSITFDFSTIGWNSASLRDLWAHKDLGTFTTSFTANVATHGVVMLKATRRS